MSPNHPWSSGTTLRMSQSPHGAWGQPPGCHNVPVRLLNNPQVVTKSPTHLWGTKSPWSSGTTSRMSQCPQPTRGARGHVPVPRLTVDPQPDGLDALPARVILQVQVELAAVPDAQLSHF